MMHLKKQIKENEDFNDLIKNWTQTSQKILLMMNKKEKIFIKNTTQISYGLWGNGCTYKYGFTST